MSISPLATPLASTSLKSLIADTLLAIVIVFVAPVPLAVTPAPTKFSIDALVDSAEPSSCTVSVLPTVPGSNSLLLAFQISACPFVGAEVVISTSDNASMLAAAIRASALAFVKYKLLEPSATVSVLPCVKVNTPVELLYASCVLFSLIALLALASVKYKFVDPSLRSSVSLLAKSVLKSLVA